MRLPFFQVDAFARAPFHGNPAAVCLLDAWLDEPLLQAIAAENNLSETAFLVAAGTEYELRWFTPKLEVPLCGHATLASAYVVFEFLQRELLHVRFHTKSGVLVATREDELISLDLPASPPEPRPVSVLLEAAVGMRPTEAGQAGNFALALLEREEDVRALSPDPQLVARLEAPGLIVTAPGSDVDFVSRCFAPRLGIEEDPVTGAAHCALVPFWSRRLGRKSLRARQLSARGGELDCTDLGDRVALAGNAVLVIEGTFHTRGA